MLSPADQTHSHPISLHPMGARRKRNRCQAHFIKTTTCWLFHKTSVQSTLFWITWYHQYCFWFHLLNFFFNDVWGRVSHYQTYFECYIFSYLLFKTIPYSFFFKSRNVWGGVSEWQPFQLLTARWLHTNMLVRSTRPCE
jgi:hypothetical protein